MIRILFFLLLASVAASGQYKTVQTPVSSTPNNNDILQRKGGKWVPRSPSQLKVDLAYSVYDIAGMQAALDSARAAENLTGTVPDARLPAVVVRNNANTSLSGIYAFTDPGGGEGRAIEVVLNSSPANKVRIGWRSIIFPNNDASGIAFTGAGSLQTGGGKRLELALGNSGNPGKLYMPYGNFGLNTDTATHALTLPAGKAIAIYGTTSMNNNYSRMVIDNGITNGFVFNVQNAGTGPLSFLSFQINGIPKFTVDANNTSFNSGLLPSLNNTHDLGRYNSPFMWRYAYIGTGIGIGALTAAPVAALQILKTTDQIWSGYDASNYFKATTNSTGKTTFAASGVNRAFEFSAPLILSVSEYADNASAVAAGLTAGMLYRSGDNLKIVH